MNRRQVLSGALWRPAEPGPDLKKLDNPLSRTSILQHGGSPEVSARYVALIDRAAEMLEPHAAREDVADRLAWLWYNSDWIKDGLRRHLRGRMPAEVLRYLPEFGRAPDRQVRVTMLVRQSDWFRVWRFNRPDDIYSRCVLQGQVLWIAFMDNEQDRTVGLVGIDLAARRTHALWQTSVQTRYIWGMSLVGMERTCSLRRDTLGEDHSNAWRRRVSFCSRRKT